MIPQLCRRIRRMAMPEFSRSLTWSPGRRGVATGTLLVIRSDVRPPDEEARKYIQKELASSSMVAAAQVVEGIGFRGAAMRSVLTMCSSRRGLATP
jgi:hypothetical protein